MLLLSTPYGLQAAEARAPQTNQAILLVEDEPDVAAVLSLVLTRAGYQTSRVASAAAAMTTLAHTRPDLIITDITLPDMDGIALCAQLRTDARTATIPVVMITGRAEPSLHAAAYAAGAAIVLTKPFQIDDFRAAVRAQLAAATKENTND